MKTAAKTAIGAVGKLKAAQHAEAASKCLKKINIT